MIRGRSPERFAIEVDRIRERLIMHQLEQVLGGFACLTIGIVELKFMKTITNFGLKYSLTKESNYMRYLSYLIVIAQASTFIFIGASVVIHNL